MNNGIAGMRMWIFTEIEYDKEGNAKILKSFAKPSKSSSVKQGQRKVSTKTQAKQEESTELF